MLFNESCFCFIFFFSTLESRRERGADLAERGQAKVSDEEAFLVLQVFRSGRRRPFPADGVVLRRHAAAEVRRSSRRRLHRLRRLQGKGDKGNFWLGCL